jgi:hypothetical protein
VIFPYFEKKKQIGFERTINSSLSVSKIEYEQQKTS